MVFLVLTNSFFAGSFEKYRFLLAARECVTTTSSMPPPSGSDTQEQKERKGRVDRCLSCHKDREIDK